jgi:transposase
VSQLLERFNQRGLAALLIASGRGRKATSTPQQRGRIVQALRRAPDRQEDATAIWSLSTLREALRKQALPKVGVSPIRQVLPEAG